MATQRQVWINLLGLLPASSVTILVIGIAFLRFYDARDFEFLGIIAESRLWSNRLTVAALVATLANLGVEWNRRNRETDRLAAEEYRRAEEEQRRVEEEQRRVQAERRRAEKEQRRAEAERRRAEAERRQNEENRRAARRDRIEAESLAAQIRFQLDPNEAHRQALTMVLQLLDEYGVTLEGLDRD